MSEFKERRREQRRRRREAHRGRLLEWHLPCGHERLLEKLLHELPDRDGMSELVNKVRRVLAEADWDRAMWKKQAKEARAELNEVRRLAGCAMIETDRLAQRTIGVHRDEQDHRYRALHEALRAAIELLDQFELLPHEAMDLARLRRIAWPLPGDGAKARARSTEG